MTSLEAQQMDISELNLASLVLRKRILKLHWMGMDREAKEIVNALKLIAPHALPSFARSDSH